MNLTCPFCGSSVMSAEPSLVNFVSKSAILTWRRVRTSKRQSMTTSPLTEVAG